MTLLWCKSIMINLIYVFIYFRADSFTGNGTIIPWSKSQRYLLLASKFSYNHNQRKRSIWRIFHWTYRVWFRCCTCIFVRIVSGIFTNIRSSVRTPIYLCYGDIKAWTLFLHSCPFVGGNHRWPVDLPHKSLAIQYLDVFFDDIFVEQTAICWTNSGVTGYLRHDEAHVTSLQRRI